MQARPSEFDPRICITAQHRDLLDQVLDVFRVVPHHDLDLMLPGQTLFQSTGRILTALEAVLMAERPHLVLVQGDTTTTMAGALASFYARMPVGHVEAGLRTGDPGQPFPEEMNRLLTTRLASIHFAPTKWAADNLRREGVSAEAIAVTGNTGIDAVLHVTRALETGAIQPRSWSWLDASRKLILVTAHRRENFGSGIEQLCEALAELAVRPEVQIAFPVHPNPNVEDPVSQRLGGHRNIQLLKPLPYVDFVDLMRRAYLLLSDSGGIQEEAPSLGKPVLILRNTTERPEAVDAGTAALVGTQRESIVNATAYLLDNPDEYRTRSTRHNPFGDGAAASRISDLILSFQTK